MSIKYSDGDIEGEILRILQAAPESELGSERAIAIERYGEWPIRYHLSPERGNLVRHLDFSGLDVLELGAGMGAVSRRIAESAKSLTVVEGTERRFAALSARLRDLKNWQGFTSNIQDLSDESFDGRKFDVVCVIGVLEYSELYIERPPGYAGSPFHRFLEQARSFLKPDGALVLAIENRFGMKYWAGVPEDHTGRILDGIVGYPLQRSPKTFTRQELRTLFAESGFGAIDEYYPFPDYKIVATVVSDALAAADPRMAGEMAISRPFQGYTAPRREILPDSLLCESVAKAGLLPEFANSFLFVADNQAPSKLKARRRPEAAAWHYAHFNRQVGVQTRVDLPPGDVGATMVHKVFDAEAAAALSQRLANTQYRWQPARSASRVEGISLILFLARLAEYSRWSEFEQTLQAFIAFARREFASPDSPDRPNLLRPDALDLTASNVKVAGDLVRDVPAVDRLRFQPFDLEWSATGPLEISDWIFRVVLSLNSIAPLLKGSPWRDFRALFEALARHAGVATPDFEGALAREIEFQVQVTRETAANIRGGTVNVFCVPFGGVIASDNPARVMDIGIRGLGKEIAKRVLRKAGLRR